MIKTQYKKCVLKYVVFLSFTKYTIVKFNTIYFSVMRLGKKKEKDRELEKQCIDGIARLICSPKQSHPIPLRGISHTLTRVKQLILNLISFHFSVHRWHRMDRC